MEFWETFWATMWGALGGAVVGAAAAWVFSLDLRRRDAIAHSREAKEQATAQRTARMGIALGNIITELATFTGVIQAQSAARTDVHVLGIDHKGDSAIARELARLKAAESEADARVYGAIAQALYISEPAEGTALESIWEAYRATQYLDDGERVTRISDMNLQIIRWVQQGRKLGEFTLKAE